MIAKRLIDPTGLVNKGIIVIWDKERRYTDKAIDLNC